MERRASQRTRTRVSNIELRWPTLLRRQQGHREQTAAARCASIGIDGADIDRELPQPTIGWMPEAAILSENSSAPNMLSVSVSAKAGWWSFLGKLGELGDLDRALEQRTGRVNVKVDKSGARHGADGLCRWDGAESYRHRRHPALAWADSPPHNAGRRAAGVHAGAADRPRRPAFPPGGQRRPHRQSCGIRAGV